MLVLTVRDQESIVIGRGDSEVLVKVVQLDRGKCRLGVTCSRDIEVDREVVRQRKDADLGGEG